MILLASSNAANKLSWASLAASNVSLLAAFS